MISSKPTSLWGFLICLLEPVVLYVWAVSYYLLVCIERVWRSGNLFAPLTQSHEIRGEAFGRFWLDFSIFSASRGRETAQTNDQDVVLEGFPALIPPLLARASGVVLDIGPGSGTQVSFLRSPLIRTIYGAEPCLVLHEELHRQLASTGLKEKYHILPCSVDKNELVLALRKHGVLLESDSHNDGKANQIPVFDTIVCVRVLCSVPEPDRTINDLYDLLRPGGRLLIAEHVVNPWQSRKGSVAARLAQSLYSLMGWSFFLGGCQLNRDTTSLLQKAAEKDGGWETFDLESSFEWGPLPYISGVLVKKTKSS